ncbi:hypothetical protein FACUT_816 [Fusarium acutatum]|uniref:Uncharacterized protein n=1 Tax=Fusarium acutatum TaxID=78861 RepID=A0A8H4K3Z0_9HYPO|nr:hypothetical protein FACUT_816 [Fusarium acutatum]
MKNKSIGSIQNLDPTHKKESFSWKEFLIISRDFETFRKMKTEIIVAIVSLIVALPPAVYALNAWHRRRSQSTWYPSHRAHLSRHRSELFCSVSERGITLALRVEDGLPTTLREPMLRVSNHGMALS